MRDRSLRVHDIAAPTFAASASIYLISGQTEVIRECAPRARDFTQRRCRYKGQIVDEVAWTKNRTKSKVRARVEHVFQVMKLKFGFVKVRYRGLKKNAHRLFVTCALVNLFVSRRKLLAVA
jgi:transposase, IS5 family